MTIGYILETSFRAALDTIRGGRVWATDELNDLADAGRIMIGDMGDDDFDVETITIPVTWTVNDEARASTEAKKIALAKDLIVNTINAAEDLFTERLRNNPLQRLVVSQTVRFWLTPVSVVPGEPALYTLCCFAVRNVDE